MDIPWRSCPTLYNEQLVLRGDLKVPGSQTSLQGRQPRSQGTSAPGMLTQ